MAGLVTQSRAASREADDKPLVAATMFGVTTPCVERARETLERAGYEVLVFHATGNGGQAMESLDRRRPDRRRARHHDDRARRRARRRLPHRRPRPARRRRARPACRRWCRPARSTWSTSTRRSRCPRSSRTGRSTSTTPNVTLMRTTPEENARDRRRDRAEAVGGDAGPSSVLLPARGVSAIERRASRSTIPARARRCTTRSAPACAAREVARAGSAHQRSGVRRRGGAEADRADECERRMPTESTADS